MCGQYYNAVVTTANGVTKKIERFLKDNSKQPDRQTEYVFAKLTEHSWVGNGYVEAVCRYITNKRGRIAWIGDYANEEMLKSFDGTIAPMKPHDLYHIEKPNGAVKIQKTIVTGYQHPISNHKYILNHSRKEYVDIKRYCELSDMKEDGYALDNAWIQHPIPLLTAVGNGQGGGDYWGVNEKFIGRYAYDELEISDKLPEGYEQFDIFFNENLEDERENGVA